MEDFISISRRLQGMLWTGMESKRELFFGLSAQFFYAFNSRFPNSQKLVRLINFVCPAHKTDSYGAERRTGRKMHLSCGSREGIEDIGNTLRLR